MLVKSDTARREEQQMEFTRTDRPEQPTFPDALAEALAIARGDSRGLPTLTQLYALHDEYLRVLALNGTLIRSLEMLAASERESTKEAVA